MEILNWILEYLKKKYREKCFWQLVSHLQEEKKFSRVNFECLILHKN